MAPSIIEFLSYALIPTFILIHLAIAPYTKVEESFNIQAIHDILVHGIPTSNAGQFFSANYDHVSFPGSVPRTFAGAVMVAGLVRPWVSFVGDMRKVQVAVRAVLGLLNAFALVAFARSVRRVFGKGAGIWYALLQASQFHVIYYASRTLPNSFAFIFSTLALKSLLDANTLPRNPLKASKNHRQSLYLLTLAGIIFRSELALLVSTQTLYLLLTRKASLTTIIPAGLLGLITGLAITVPLDSYFWQTFPLWPEWTAFYYNTIQGQSSAWGTSPPTFYFLNALPRLLLNPLTYILCIPTALWNPATRSRTLDLLLHSLAYITLYSLLPHKEPRFIIYTIPALTAVAAAGSSALWHRRGKSLLANLIALALASSILASFIISSTLLTLSSQNYPGGTALSYLHTRARLPSSPPQRPLTIYFDNLASQTGITRFQEESHHAEHITTTITDALGAEPQDMSSEKGTWRYDKSEDTTKLRDPRFWAKFDYVLAERPEKVIGKWEALYVVFGFDGVRVLRPGEESGGGSAMVGVEEVIDGVGEGDWTARIAGAWRGLEGVVRQRVLRGWWVEVRMVPKIYILVNRMRDGLEEGEV